jgi:prophage tail gpP-like protein
LTTTYKVKEGDNFENIARRVYGIGSLAYIIQAANPLVVEPLLEGRILTIPNDPNGTAGQEFSPLSDNENEVNILIGELQFKFWSTITISKHIDSFDTFTLTGPFDTAYRNILRPLTYKTIQIAVGSQFLFTGTLINVQPVLDIDSNRIVLEGYSLPGVLNDCTIPPSEFDRLQFNNVGLEIIAPAVCAPFGISTQFDVASGVNFSSVALRRDEKVLKFLIKLAQERQLIISSTPKGKLLFTQSRTGGVIVAKFREGEAPLLSAAANFNSQSYYSDVVGVNAAIVGSNPLVRTAKNPRLSGVVRPLVFQNNSFDSSVLQNVADDKLGRMFANSVSYTITVATWRDSNGILWSPNTFVSLLAESVMVYEAFTFIIRNVKFVKSVEGETAELTLMMPGAFSGSPPERLPWES